MAALTLQKTWTIQLTTPELRLVLKALGGRLAEPGDEDATAAAQLGNRLTEIRGKLLKQSEHDGERLEAIVNG